MIDVVILGAGALAQEVYWAFLAGNEQKQQWNVIGFVDDDSEMVGASRCGLPVLGTFQWLERNAKKHIQVISGVGNPKARQAFAERATALGFQFCSAIHPGSQVSPWAKIGPGTIISAGAVVSNHTQVGSHVLVNTGSTVGHDVIVGAYCIISPGCHLSGSVTFGQGIYFGTGAVIVQGCRIGDWSIIGAGAVVTEDVPSHVTAVGVPCRVIKWHEVKALAAVGGRV